MKKSRIFIAAGTFVLAISAIFATKANKKFVSVATAYWAKANYYLHGAGSILTTISSTGHSNPLSITLKTSSGGLGVGGELTTAVAGQESKHLFYN